MICDFAEVYGIYDYRRLPARYVGILAEGLSDNSRIKMAMSGVSIPRDTLILASIADSLSFIAWSKTKDAEKGRNRPSSLVTVLLGESDANSGIVTYNSADEYERARERILKGDK